MTIELTAVAPDSRQGGAAATRRRVARPSYLKWNSFVLSGQEGLYEVEFMF